MFGIKYCIDRRIRRRIQFTFHWNHRHSVAQNAARKCFIIDFRQIDQLPIQRTYQRRTRSRDLRRFRLRQIPVFEQNQCEHEGQSHRNHKTDHCIDKIHTVIGINIHGHTRNTRAYRRKSLYFRQTDEKTADKAGCAHTHHHFFMLQGHTVQSRLGNTEQSGDTGRNRGGTKIFILRFQSYCQTCSAFRNVMCQRRRKVQHVKSRIRDRCHRIRYKRLVHTQGDHKWQDRRNQRHCQPAKAVVKSKNHGGQKRSDIIAQRSQDQKCYRERNRKAHQRHKEYPDRFRADLVEKPLDDRHKRHGQNRREYLSRITHILKRQAKERRAAFGCQQRRRIGIDHGAHSRYGYQPIDVQLRRRSHCYKNRQIIERRIRHIIKHFVDRVVCRQYSKRRQYGQQRF